MIRYLYILKIKQIRNEKRSGMSAAGAMALGAALSVLFFTGMPTGSAGFSQVRFFATGFACFFFHRGGTAAARHFAVGKMALQRKTEDLHAGRQRHEERDKKQ
ncbi:MAG TPA: hypothetical protein PK198_01220 [Saprospiraceae bacterium]|nr:hypothetical protein [Saprospiraceae bacterium]HRJ16165.1 hypothetical protein [Saprospiraceae bacterium]